MIMAPNANSAGLDAATVLIVEDEEPVRMPIAEYLRDCGYHVLEAGDADEAIGLVNADARVDVVFSDVRMPGDKDGFALARWLHDHYPDVPVLLTSGYSAQAARGADLPRVIEKPYSQVRVREQIRHLIGR